MVSEEILPINQRLSEHEISEMEYSGNKLLEKYALYARSLQALEKEVKEYKNEGKIIKEQRSS